ncbi:MAG: biopolymer transporter ExbD [Myxococcota bacterium]
MRVNEGTPERSARVELIPLIDTIFLLLAFFLFAMVSMVVEAGLQVELPAVAGKVLDSREAVVITITADDALFVNGKPVALESLPETLRLHLDEDPDRPVWIRGDSDASLGVSFQLLTSLREAGASQVSFQTREVLP